MKPAMKSLMRSVYSLMSPATSKCRRYKLLGPSHFSSSTFAKNASSSPNSITLSFDFSSVSASEVSRHKKQAHCNPASGSRRAGNILSATNFPNLPQIDSMADFRPCSFTKGGKPLLSARFMLRLIRPPVLPSETKQPRDATSRAMHCWRTSG